MFVGCPPPLINILDINKFRKSYLFLTATENQCIPLNKQKTTIYKNLPPFTD